MFVWIFGYYYIAFLFFSAAPFSFLPSFPVPSSNNINFVVTFCFNFINYVCLYIVCTCTLKCVFVFLYFRCMMCSLCNIFGFWNLTFSVQFLGEKKSTTRSTSSSFSCVFYLDDRLLYTSAHIGRVCACLAVTCRPYIPVEWMRSFACYCSSMGVEWIIFSQNQLWEKILPGIKPTPFQSQVCHLATEHTSLLLSISLLA